MKFFNLFLISSVIMVTSAMGDNDTTLESSNFTEFAESDFNFTFGFTEETLGNTQGVPLMQYQDVSNLRVYKGPLPKFPGTTANPWIALHSPVRMYIPIRNTGEDSAESEDCVQCPRNLIIYLSPRQRYILTPVPTISICSSFARRSGRVHVAVVSGPKPAQRLYAGRHQVELMVWKAEGPVHSCQYTILVKGRKRVPVIPKRLPCPQPEHPTDGVLLCDEKGKKYYSHDSVCQIFCPPNYLIENTSRNSSTIICKNGQWTSETQISCIAEFCPDLPRIGEHSYWNCNVKDSAKHFSNGTQCRVNCASGYVIPSSETGTETVTCNLPTWDNLETIPVCKRAYLPRLQFCQNRHIYIRPSQSIKISSFMFPKGTSQAGVPLSPVCSLQGKRLSKGKHENICEVIDPELKTRQKCSYQINIEENTGPYPHSGDCRNRTVYTNRKGTIHLKPVRFLTKIGQPLRTKVLRSKCKPKGDIGVGNHFIVCKVTDPHTKISATCSYWLNVQRRICSPLKEISNGQIICSSREVGSVCHYKCDQGYSFVGNHSTRATKICQSNRRWQPFLNPVCKIEPPTLIEGCNNLEVQMTSTENFTVPLPTFLTAVNETLNVSCTPLLITTTGLHQILCQVDDDKLNTTCHFNVSVLLKEELTTTEISDTLPKDEYPTLIVGCDNLEVNLSTPVHYTVPTPQYVTTLNETLNVSCMPIILTAAGHHQIICTSDNSDFNVSCHFNVSIQIEDELTSLLSPEKDEYPKLIEGCNRLEVNLSTPVHYRVPTPQYLTTLNDTLNVSCIPNLLTSAGEHQIICSSDNSDFNVSCHFNVSIQMEDELTPLLSPEKDLDFQLTSGCTNISINASVPINFTIPQPEYQSSSGDTTFGSCFPSLINITGSHVVNCIVENEDFNTSCLFNVTIIPQNEVISLIASEKGSCTPLLTTLHSSIECAYEGQTEICHVICDPGFGFSEDDFFSVACSGSPEWVWNSQNFDFNGTLPDCLPQLEGSAVEVWISFEAIASHCGEELHEQINDMISEICEQGTNCSKIFINCTLDEESDRMLMIVNWTVQADFIDEEHYDDEEIPEAEIRLEAVMENTRNVLTSDTVPEGIEFFRDSFRKGFITLVCPDGFMPNTLMSKCVQCSKESKSC